MSRCRQPRNGSGGPFGMPREVRHDSCCVRLRPAVHCGGCGRRAGRGRRRGEDPGRRAEPDPGAAAAARAPSLLVDLGGLDQLRGIRTDGDELVIGAMTTHAEVAASPLVAEHAPLVAQATAQIGDRQVRHRGTLGGSLAHADPAGDLPAVALALDATYVIAGPSGRRTVPAADFGVDLFTTAIGPDEVLVEVRFPR